MRQAYDYERDLRKKKSSVKSFKEHHQGWLDRTASEANVIQVANDVSGARLPLGDLDTSTGVHLGISVLNHVRKDLGSSSVVIPFLLHPRQLLFELTDLLLMLRGL